MKLTAAAEWLNSVFAGFDSSIAIFAHSLHESAAGEFFDGIFPLITLLGEHGIFFIVLSVVFLIFKKTRKFGLAMIIALAIGALITNVCLKNLVARPRPYIYVNGIYYKWWLEMGRVLENDLSFPSGHTTAAFAAMTALFMQGNKKYSWTAFILALLIGFSRIYLYVHYASDVLCGMIVGIIAGIAAWFICKKLRKAKCFAH